MSDDGHLGDVRFSIVGMVKDLRARGLSREDATEVIAEIDRRRRQYRDDPTVVPPFRREGRR